MTYPRYTPERVTCRHCGVSWSGNKNGLRRHEEMCAMSAGSSDQAPLATDSHGLRACTERMLEQLAEQDTFIRVLGEALNRAGYLASGEYPTHVAEHLEFIANANAAYREWTA